MERAATVIRLPVAGCRHCAPPCQQKLKVADGKASNFCLWASICERWPEGPLAGLQSNKALILSASTRLVQRTEKAVAFHLREHLRPLPICEPSAQDVAMEDVDQRHGLFRAKRQGPTPFRSAGSPIDAARSTVIRSMTAGGLPPGFLCGIIIIIMLQPFL
jgi:hypothetical protein